MTQRLYPSQSGASTTTYKTAHIAHGFMLGPRIKVLQAGTTVAGAAGVSVDALQSALRLVLRDVTAA